MERFKVDVVSVAALVGPEAVVVDMTSPVMIGTSHYKGQHEVICECDDTEWALTIASALNRAPVEVAAHNGGLQEAILSELERQELFNATISFQGGKLWIEGSAGIDVKRLAAVIIDSVKAANP